MTKPKRDRTVVSDRDFSGVITQFIISYLRHKTPNGTLERVLLSAGETRAAEAGTEGGLTGEAPSPHFGRKSMPTPLLTNCKV